MVWSGLEWIRIGQDWIGEKERVRAKERKRAKEKERERGSKSIFCRTTHRKKPIPRYSIFDMEEGHTVSRRIPYLVDVEVERRIGRMWLAGKIMEALFLSG